MSSNFKWALIMAKRVVGKVELSQGNWIIHCEPYVRAKVKRVFPQVKQHAAESIMLSHNDQNCDDLSWFMSQYPMEISLEDDLILRGASDRHNALQETITDILNYKKPARDFKLEIEPYGYQKIGAELLLSVKGLLIADDVGLGKTLQAIIPMTFAENLPVLFVTLTHLPRQMEREINLCVPHLKTHILAKGSPYPLEDKQGVYPDVIICGYSKLNGWADELAGKITYVVFDEIQELRRNESLKYHAAKLIALKAELRLGLSATPIYNYGSEFFNIIDVLRPDELGTNDEFKREWCDAYGKSIGDPVSFGNYLRTKGVMLLRKREDPDVKMHLPPVMTSVQHIDCDVGVLDKVKNYAAELARIILQTSQDFKGQKLQASGEFDMLMRQATGISKAPYVAEFVKMLLESGESVVLFGWHRAVYDIWLERLAEYNPVLYTGTESIAGKERSKDMFLSGKSRVLIVSLRSGAGLDGLQFHPNCSIGVFGELDWSSGVHDQCKGRLFRNGQTKSLTMYYLLSESGSDPVIADVLGLKKSQLDGVRNVEEDLFTQLQQDTGRIRHLAEKFLIDNKVKKDAVYSQQEMDTFVNQAREQAFELQTNEQMLLEGVGNEF